MSDDAHREAFYKNLNRTYEDCDNCEKLPYGYQMCPRHAEESLLTDTCPACGTRRLREEGEPILEEPLCEPCKVDPPQAYSDWKGHERGKKLAKDLVRLALTWEKKRGGLADFRSVLLSELEAAFPETIQRIPPFTITAQEQKR